MPYVLHEPMTRSHPSDVDERVSQLNSLVEGGNSVLLVEHDMTLVAGVIGLGPGAGDEGGAVVASSIPTAIASAKKRPDCGHI